MVRGVSSVGVVIAHSTPKGKWPGHDAADFLGALSVDFFIIITGFLMTWTLGKGTHGFPRFQDRDRILAFYLRRFFRITPLFYVAFLVSLLFVPHSFGFSLLYLTYCYGLFPGYAELSANPSVWSITLEMQFYLVVPFLYLACRYVRPALLFFGCEIATFLSNRLWGWADYPGLLGVYIHPTFLPLILPVFIIGILIGLHYLKSPHAPSLPVTLLLMALVPLACRPLKNIVACTLLAMIATLLLSLSRQKRGSFLEWTRRARDRFLDSISRSRLVKAMADYSYGLYLFHYFVLTLLRPFIPALPVSSFGALTLQALLTAVVTLAITYPIAMITFNVIEVPGVNLGRKLVDRFARSSA